MRVAVVVGDDAGERRVAVTFSRYFSISTETM
jgi:hypothetical protein